jgi:hypothetical protein
VGFFLPGLTNPVIDRGTGYILLISWYKNKDIFKFKTNFLNSLTIKHSSILIFIDQKSVLAFDRCRGSIVGSAFA